MRSYKHPNRKLKFSQVIAIRADGRSTVEIARDYPITQQAVSKIKNRRSYKHVQESSDAENSPT